MHTLSAASAALIDRVQVAALAWVGLGGRPISCAVTPYLVGGQVVVTSTLAFPGKARALRRDPRVGLLVAGIRISGRAEVAVDTTSEWFDLHLRDQELRKFPPAKALLGVPFHRQFFPFYVGRIVMTISAESIVEGAPERSSSLASLRDGSLVVEAIDLTPTQANEQVLLPTKCGDGPAEILCHEESTDFADRRQLRILGSVAGGLFREERRVGSLSPKKTSTISQLRDLQNMRRLARASRSEITAWPTVQRTGIP